MFALRPYNRDTVKAPKTKIDVILKSSDNIGFTIQLDEASSEISIPKHGVKVKNRRPPYATLEMTESRAIDLELI